MRRELTTEYQLFAENRAFALRDNFEILEDELKRLALLPEMDPTGADLLPEQQILAGAHAELGPLQHRGAAAVGRRHVRALGARSPRVRGQSFGDRPWFKAARAGATGPLFRATDEPDLGRTLKIVQPVVRDGVFAGALVGVIALGEDNLITPALHDNLPRETDARADRRRARQVIYPPGRARPPAGSDWARAIAAARAAAPGR